MAQITMLLGITITSTGPYPGLYCNAELFMCQMSLVRTLDNLHLVTCKCQNIHNLLTAVPRHVAYTSIPSQQSPQ